MIYSNELLNVFDVTSAVSKKGSDFIWHVAVRVHRQAYYFLGTSNGVKWSKPSTFGRINIANSTEFQISFVANYDVSSTVFFVYTLNNVPPSLNYLHALWTLNHGETWNSGGYLPLTHSYFNPYGFLYTSNGNPTLFLSDYTGKYIISTFWSESELDYDEGNAPLKYPVYTPQVSQPSLLQVFGEDNLKNHWLSYSNQTAETIFEDMEA